MFYAAGHSSKCRVTYNINVGYYTAQPFGQGEHIKSQEFSSWRDANEI